MSIKNEPSRSPRTHQPSVHGKQQQFVESEILHGLPARELKVVLTKAKFVSLPVGTILNQIERPIRFGYFLNSGVASILNVLSSGKSVEVGMTGCEGFVGTPIVLGLPTSPVRIIMQIGGTGYRIGTKSLGEILRECPQLEKFLRRYAQEVGMQAVQVAACNRLHVVDARLARWLLMSRDRIGGEEVPLTQQFLAHMLGTRRASVTVAAGSLQKAGAIRYGRGNLKIVDRRKLETIACECYAKLKKHERLWQAELRKSRPQQVVGRLLSF